MAEQPDQVETAGQDWGIAVPVSLPAALAWLAAVPAQAGYAACGRKPTAKVAPAARFVVRHSASVGCLEPW